MTKLYKGSLSTKKSLTITGVDYATCCSGTKYRNRDDLLLIVLDPGSYICGCFTLSTMPSSPVIWSKKNNKKANNKKHKIVLFINAGNANAFTGEEGLIACNEKAKALSDLFNCDERNIFLASTGVIGEKLPYKEIINQFNYLKDNLSHYNFDAASSAILTTDLKPKTYSKKFKVFNKLFTISGFSKGSGMIFPNMATMLAFIFTDFAIDRDTLASLTKRAVDESFNRISVDGDTSTSDTVFVSTTNKKNLKITTEKRLKAIDKFYSELRKAMVDLAKKIVMDGEGAKKFIEIRVKNSKSIQRAKKICFSIANSLLVKTAIAGEDANWGRLVMAIGKTQINVQTKKIKIYIQGILLCLNGRGIDNVDEFALSNSLKNKNIKILIDLAEGNEEFTSWTSDLTEEYIKINADYRS